MFSNQPNLFDPQSTSFSQPVSEDFRLTADESAQSKPSSQPVAENSVVAAPTYFLDPGNTNAGIKTPSGYILRGVRKVSGKNRKTGQTLLKGDPTSGFNMVQVAEILEKLQRGKLVIENAQLPNGTGVTPKFIDAMQRIGYRVRLISTRETKKGYTTEACAAGHKYKKDGCDECTKRDLDALDHLHTTCPNRFYKWHPNRSRCGSKNVSGSLAAEINTRLNQARFDPSGSYTSVEMPDWLRNTFRTLMAPAAIAITVRQVVKQFPNAGWRFCKRAIANHCNARKSQNYSDFNKHLDKAERAKVNPAAKKYFREFQAQSMASSQPVAENSRVAAPAAVQEEPNCQSMSTAASSAAQSTSAV